MSFEKLENNKDIAKPDGVSFETPLGKNFKSVDIKFPDEQLPVREEFDDRAELKDIIQKTREFRSDFPETFNGILLGNMNIESVDNDAISLTAKKLRYHIYFAAHKLRQEKPETMDDRYAALSTCGIIYDTHNNCFYLNVRPDNSQEDPGMVDAPGGVLNPEFNDADPFATIKDRFNKKLGLKTDDVVSLGIERIFDEHHSLHNIVMYSEVDDEKPTVDQSNFKAISLDEVEDFLSKNELTSVAKATILLTLSQDKFEKFGWGEERVKKIMES